MEKQFLVFSHSNKNARIENLMKKLDLESRMVEIGTMPAKETIQKEIKWKHVKRLLKKERQSSMEFIEMCLSIENSMTFA